MADEAVMLTNDDATNCKRYAVHKGYWDDNYIQYFIPNIPNRKTPEINRGYYIRYRAVHDLVNQFLTRTNGNCQIVNLGAGFDTLYWNLHETNSVPKLGVYEVDLKQVVRRKCSLVNSKQQLRSCLTGNVKIDEFCIDSEFYHLMSADMRNPEELNNKLMLTGIQKNIPTLFLVECVFVYLSPMDTEKLLKYVTDDFVTVMVIDYDPVNLNDRFGEVMKQNLRGRKCHLLGAQPDLNSKKQSYAMFSTVNAKLFVDIYSELQIEEKQRVEKLEFLDEVDLLLDLLKHYCICWVYQDRDNVMELNKISL